MYKLVFVICSAILLSACGTLTGIPSHGGGKRFAIEQELVAAASRAAIKNMDLAALQNHRVALYITVMGDQGSGVITGGRYSVDALIRGEYLNNPLSITDYDYPSYLTNATTTAGDLSSVTHSDSVLNSPSVSRNRNSGGAGKRSISLSTGGTGEYRNETLISNPRDVTFLDNLVQMLFFLRGIDVVAPEYADTDVFITVDVFGTIRSRTELHLYNAETLRAVTKLEYFAVERDSHRLLITPTVSAQQAIYEEKYALWMGPLNISKTLKPASGLLVSFAGITPYSDTSTQQSEPQWKTENNAAAAPPVNRDILRKRQQRGQQ